MVTGGVRRLSTVVSFHLEASVILPGPGLDEVSVLLNMVALQDVMFASIASTAISALSMKKESDSYF